MTQITQNPIIEERGEVALQLDGEAFKLVPSYQNLAAIEAALGMGIPALLARWQVGDVQITQLAKIITAVAEPTQPVTPGAPRWNEERIGEALLAGDLPGAITALTLYLGGIMSAGSGGEDEADNPVKGGDAPGKPKARRKKSG